ncbi:MAG: Methyltransferase type 11 [Acidobacteriaceae bacterium]|nr:Methyltransferase type 11 [Acidobacteriaceae bacterium]
MSRVPLLEQFGNVDIYLFDQLLRGTIVPGMRVLDAGCGGGRNLVYLLREGYECFGVDGSAEAVEWVRAMAARLSPSLPAGNFRVEAIEAMSFPDAIADVVLCNSVLHFARDDVQFEGMLRGLWRVLKPGGMLFCRLASTIGGDFQWVVGSASRRRYLVPDGQEWYLVDEPLLMRLTMALGGELMDPLKTTVVQGSRCMTTWVVRKNS